MYLGIQLSDKLLKSRTGCSKQKSRDKQRMRKTMG